MKAIHAHLLTFLDGTKQFQVPIFQRRYDWKEKECKQLWDDVLRVGANEDIPSYFLGSIVSMQHGIYHASGVTQLLLIDGQQRLATLSLLLAALGKAIEAGSVEIGITRRKLENRYLFNADETDKDRYKQLLTEHDKETLIRLLDSKELPANSSPRLLENYRFFEEKLQHENLEAVYKGIQKLMIVDIALEPDSDNPQLIFESLNSKGVKLEAADLIRNYMLMGQEPDFQSRLYRDYWFPMEQRFGEEYIKRFNRFMRDYLTLKTRQIPKINNVYDKFKEYMGGQKSPEALETIIKDIYDYSRYYVRIALLQEESPKLLTCFEDIQDLKVEVAFPFLLGVYEDYTQKIIEKTHVIEILRLIESYVFRRAICDIPTNNLNKIFAALTGQIDKNSYLQSLKIAFSQMTGNQRYPSDSEFKQALLTKNVYNFDRRKYLLRKLENHGHSKEPVRVEDYTIEHVMPQNPDLSEEWQEELGKNWREIHGKYLHTIGNLTLTGYNSELSDRSFREKQNIPGGFRNSPLTLNHSIAQVKRWDETAIVNRAKMLSEKALNIWIDHCLPKAKQRDKKGNWTLDDHHHLTGEMMELFQQLQQRVLKLNASVSERITKRYIGYRVNTTFVVIFPRATRLRLLLNLPFSDINDPQGVCRDLANMSHHQLGNIEVYLYSTDECELDYIMFLIRQAFERQRA